jgi:hypothetical protein
MRPIDEMNLQPPFYVSRSVCAVLQEQGHTVNHKRVQCAKYTASGVRRPKALCQPPTQAGHHKSVALARRQMNGASQSD